MSACYFSKLRHWVTEGKNMKRIGLALGGGGARGICHMAFVQVLDELGLKPSIISGTSMGAIIGAFYAAGMSGSEMIELTDRVGIKEISKMVDINFLSPSGLVKGKGVCEFFETHLPVTRFEDLTIPLRIVATDYWNRKQVIFESGHIIEALRASISVPGLFSPVKIMDIVMIDGGAINPVPMSVIRDQCDILIAIDVSGTSVAPKKNPIPSMFDSIMNSFQIMETANVENQRKIHCPEIYIKPRLENVQILDFHQDKKILESVQEDVGELRLKLMELMKDDQKDSEIDPGQVKTEKKKKKFIFF
jgi:NTE family protein